MVDHPAAGGQCPRHGQLGHLGGHGEHGDINHGKVKLGQILHQQRPPVQQQGFFGRASRGQCVHLAQRQSGIFQTGNDSLANLACGSHYSDIPKPTHV